MNIISSQTDIETSALFDSTQINLLPADVLQTIFENLDFKKLVSCSHVCHLWKKLIKIPFKYKVYHEFAFNPFHWNEFCGKDTVTQDEVQNAYHLLPDKIMKILTSPCPAFPDKRIIESHMLVWIPKTIKGKILTIKSFGELLKQRDEFFKNPTGYGSFWYSVFQQEGFKSIKSGWVLMTTDVIPGSGDKTYSNQGIMVKNLYKTCYEIPKVGEAVVCIAVLYFKTKKRLFSDQPLTYTRCQEYVNHAYVVVVGGFQPSGFVVKRLWNNSNYSNEFHTGVAALRRLSH